MAARLDMSESAVHGEPTGCANVTARFLRKGYAATLDDPSELDDEIRSLFNAIRTESSNR